MSGIDGWKVDVINRIKGAVDFDRPILAIDPMEQTAMFQMPFGMPRDQLPLKLKLHARRSFVHTRHHDFFAHPRPFDFKTGGGIIGIYGSYQQVERLDWDPIPLLQLRQTTVSKRYSQDVAN